MQLTTLLFQILKSSQIVKGMAIMAALIGVIFIGLASWSIDGYQELIANCSTFINSLLKICEYSGFIISTNYNNNLIILIFALL